ncbi:Putative metabolite transport protein YjhB [bacterium HR15]|nr:Putative metabolite transport protein YjhB [bacterium HR15]
MATRGERTGVRWYSGLTRYHWLVLAVAAAGWMFDTMDQWLYVLARQPAVADLLNKGTTDPMVARYSGIVQTWFIIGWATGGFLFGVIGDRLGRTRTMAITILMYAGFTGLSALAQNWQQLALLRFLTGLGIGGEFAAGAALVAETFPAHARPTALGIMQACSAIGNLMAAMIYRVVAPEFGWRWVFAIGFFPALLVFIIRLFVREPQRWEQARALGQHLGSLSELFGEPLWRRHTFIGVGLAAVGVVGFWGIGTWSPDLLTRAINPTGDPELRALVEERKAYAVMVQQVGAFFGMLGWAILAQHIGRRPTFALTFLLCLLIVPTTFFLTTSFERALLLYPLLGLFTTSLFAGYAVYFPELFPTRLRATGIGFCYNVARYLAAAAPYTFGMLTARFSIEWAATLLSGVFLLGLLILLAAPETKDNPLPA